MSNYNGLYLVRVCETFASDEVTEYGHDQAGAYRFAELIAERAHWANAVYVERSRPNGWDQVAVFPIRAVAGGRTAVKS